jgi:protein TonB
VRRLVWGAVLALCSTVNAQELIYRVAPVYPKLAIQAHIQGDIKLVAVIDEDGGIRRLRLISGHPFLVNAAMDAVKQWRYLPAIENGVPMEAAIVVTVPFRIRLD